MQLLQGKQAAAPIRKHEDCIMPAVPHAATLLANGIDLVKDDDVRLLWGKQAVVSPMRGADERQASPTQP